ncbi:hypothetical protein FPRO04_12822 [Fusarium proliferatum]|nr:hypothetical protein FPRO04_12822 [Fusarium proliferatum]
MQLLNKQTHPTLPTNTIALSSWQYAHPEPGIRYVLTEAENHVQGQRTMDDLTAGWCAMPSAENPPQSNKDKTADDYRAEADEILNRLRDVLEERPEADVPSQCVSAIMWWKEIISMRLRFNYRMDWFHREPSIGPIYV